MNTFPCKIVTPEKLVMSEDIRFISVPGTDGDIGILAKRAPIMSTLRLGVITIKKEDQGEAQLYAVSGGYFEADGYHVTVLADRAELIGSRSLEQIREAKEANQAKLDALPENDSRAAFLRDELAWYALLETNLGHRQ